MKSIKVIRRMTFKFFQAPRNLDKFVFISKLGRPDNEKDTKITDLMVVLKLSET